MRAASPSVLRASTSLISPGLAGEELPKEVEELQRRLASEKRRCVPCKHSTHVLLACSACRQCAQHACIRVCRNDELERELKLALGAIQRAEEAHQHEVRG